MEKIFIFFSPILRRSRLRVVEWPEQDGVHRKRGQDRKLPGPSANHNKRQSGCLELVRAG